MVVAPTRVQFIERSGQRSAARDDGVALYKVGARHPEPIPPLVNSLRSQMPDVDRRVAQVQSYDTKNLDRRRARRGRSDRDSE
ncbi:MAG: hypothetical protein WDO74_16750 [Pseudomonadota bacterium]